MSDTKLNADLDALVRGEAMSSGDDLIRFVAGLYGEEQNVTMPRDMKLRIAGELGLTGDARIPSVAAPISRRTARAESAHARSSRPWAIALAIAAAILLALTGVLRWGMPEDEDNNNRFLMLSPAVPTAEATPAATQVENSIWLKPLTTDECPEDELLSRDDWFDVQSERADAYTEVVPRIDEPYSEPDISDAEAAVTRQRQAMACVRSHNQVNSDALPIESNRRAWENSAEGSEHRLEIDVDRLQRSQALSSYLATDLGLTPDDLMHRSEGESGSIWDPSSAIQMADGRIVLLPGWTGTSEESFSVFEGFAQVWIEEEGEWRLDEDLFFCIGDCDDYWSRIESSYGINATPVASPEASPVADQTWLQPITPEECVTDDDGQLVDASPEDFDALPQRDYTVVGPANSADAFAANATARQYMACDYPASLLSDRYAIEASLAGEGFSPFNVVMLDRQYTNGVDLSAQVQEHGVTPADTVTAFDPDFADEEGYFIPNPTLAFTLEDGRILILSIHVSDTAARSMGATLILVQEEGEWKVDDQLPVCIGECDDMWEQLETFYADALWLSPIAAEECEVNAYWPAESSEEEIAAIKSRQFRACEMSGDAQFLHGPEFGVLEGADAHTLSEEIDSLHRQSGQTPGALQRIAPVQMTPMSDFPDEPWVAFQPHSVVTLEDGRIAVLQSTVVSPEIISGSGRTSPVVTAALVWIQDGDDWLLDEEVTVCLGDCDAFWGTDAPATPEAEAINIADYLPENCEASDVFRADLTSDPRIAIGVHPGPGRGTGLAIAMLPAGTPLQYLCESESTSSPSTDRMSRGQLWLNVRTEDGTEGWIREIDVLPATSEETAACVNDEFIPNYEILAENSINLWPGPEVVRNGALMALDPNAQLMYLCEFAPTTDPEADQLSEGQVWMKFRTEQGDEGWIREIDVRPLTSEETATPEVDVIDLSSSDGENMVSTSSPSDSPEIEPIDPVSSPTQTQTPGGDNEGWSQTPTSAPPIEPVEPPTGRVVMLRA